MRNYWSRLEDDTLDFQWLIMSVDRGILWV